MNFTVYKKEIIYFWVMVVLSIKITAFFLGGVSKLLPFLLPMILSILNVASLVSLFTTIVIVGGPLYFLFVRLPQLFAAGQIRGNGIKVTEAQFPDIFSIVRMQSARLGLHKLPDIYIMQEGGLLNTFARKLAGTRYIIISSQLLAVAYGEGRSVVEFVIAHELARMQRRRMLKIRSLLTWPSRLIPFLHKAYERSCEHTYDAMAHVLCPEGAEKGITLFAAGHQLYNQVKTREFVSQKKGFALSFYEMWFSTPQLVRRLKHIRELNTMNMLLEPTIIPATIVVEQFVTEKKQQPDTHASQELHSRFEPDTDTKEL